MKLKTLFRSRSRWTKVAWARDNYGSETSIFSPEAVSWCLSAAIEKCYPKKSCEIRSLIHSEINTSIIVYNDSHTFKDIKQLVTKLNI